MKNDFPRVHKLLLIVGVTVDLALVQVKLVNDLYGNMNGFSGLFKPHSDRINSIDDSLPTLLS